MAEVTDRRTAALAGQYRVERHLGEGGTATVYLAKDLKHDRKVAVKVAELAASALDGAAQAPRHSVPCACCTFYPSAHP